MIGTISSRRMKRTVAAIRNLPEPRVCSGRCPEIIHARNTRPKNASMLHGSGGLAIITKANPTQMLIRRSQMTKAGSENVEVTTEINSNAAPG